MVLPLALVSGSYFILSIYYYLILSFLPLHHHAQGEPAAVCPWRTRQCVCVLLVASMPFFTTRRVWDPGKVEAVNDAPAADPLPSIVKVEANGFGQCRPRSTGTACHPPFVTQRLLKHASEANRVYVSPIQSLFHYSHPILSRPTVPNIR